MSQSDANNPMIIYANRCSCAIEQFRLNNEGHAQYRLFIQIIDKDSD
ncbi:MAG: hypothetical protein NTV00_03265 [Methylococcales bacterium]|nr:hypothetical protein [Methylococcales bacterium]